MFVGNIKNPETGKTWKEDNLDSNHKYSVGDYVELCTDPRDDDYLGINGIRLYVVSLQRDCDGETLYSVGTNPLSIMHEDYTKILFRGLGEDNLKIIKEKN